MSYVDHRSDSSFGGWSPGVLVRPQILEGHCANVNMDVSENSGFFTPNHPFELRCSHDFHHPFWRKHPLFFGKTPQKRGGFPRGVLKESPNKNSLVKVSIRFHTAFFWTWWLSLEVSVRAESTTQKNTFLKVGPKKTSFGWRFLCFFAPRIANCQLKWPILPCEVRGYPHD